MAKVKKERIFISYKRVDKERVFAIKDGIEQATGEKCWIDLDGIESDAQFADVIISAINRCEVFLFMYSASHTKIVNRKKDWTIREISFAEKKDKRIVFVNIDNSPLTDWFELNFGTTQQVDATDTEKLARLHNDLCSWLKIDIRKIQQDSYKDASKAEQDRLRKEKELQERMAQAEAEKTAFDQEGTKKAWEQLSSTRMIIDDSETPTPKPTPNSRSTHKPIKKSWIWLTIAACAIVGLVIIGVRHFQQRSTILDVPVDIEPVDIEQEQLEIVQDSLRQDHIQDSIAKEQARRDALPEGEFQVGDLKYKASESNSGVTVCGRVNKAATEIHIPSQIDYGHYTYDVTSIGEEAFAYCKSLTSIIIPNSVTSIGKDAFYGCSGLTSIVVEKGNKTYDSRENCNAIIETATNTLIRGCNSTIIPNSVTSIGDYAFSYCSSLTSMTIPNSVTSIGGLAFYWCTSLTSIVVEKGNITYDSRENCNAIIETATNTLILGCNSTVIPNSVTSIGGWAFSNCVALTSITIPNSVTSIGGYAFYWCEGLTSIIIPNSVTSIGNGAFSNCESLTSIIIPNSVKSIGEHAFYWCRSLTSITIPNSVTSIGEKAFYWCTSLTSITIPNSVTSIGEEAFACCGLTSITIPNSVTSIGNGAFSNCSSLASIIIPNSVTSIGEKAFYECESLTSITIPNSVTSIGWKAFSDCKSLASIIIPNSVKRIEDFAFSYCTNLTSITIPNSVTSIGWKAFSDCKSLASIIIPNSVTSIELGAFNGCSSLKSVKIPKTLTDIGKDAFPSHTQVIRE